MAPVAALAPKWHDSEASLAARTPPLLRNPPLGITTERVAQIRSFIAGAKRLAEPFKMRSNYPGMRLGTCIT